MEFNLRNPRDDWWLLSARRLDDGVHVWGQVSLNNGDASNEDLETMLLHKLAGCIPGEREVRCHACDAPMRPDHTNHADDYQLDNALWLEFNGGYGMFIDNYDERVKAVICHECAHDLCDQIPWIGKLLNPYSSHSHKTEWKDAHPDHWGWDYHGEGTPKWHSGRHVIQAVPCENGRQARCSCGWASLPDLANSTMQQEIDDHLIANEEDPPGFKPA